MAFLKPFSLQKNMCLVKINMCFIISISSVLQKLCFKLHNQMLFLPLKSIVSKKHMALFTNTALWNLVLSWCISMSQFVTSQRGLTCIRMVLTCITMDLTCIVWFNYCDVTDWVTSQIFSLVVTSQISANNVYIWSHLVMNLYFFMVYFTDIGKMTFLIIYCVWFKKVYSVFLQCLLAKRLCF